MSNFEEIKQKLNQFIHSNFYHVIDSGEIVLKEKQKNIQPNNDGAYEITCIFSNGYGIAFELEGQDKMKYVKISNCADNIIVTFNEDNTISLHILECKSNLSDKDWVKVKKQFEGALLRFKAICGVIDLSFGIKEIIVYTAFREDKISTEESPTFFLGKGEVGVPKSTNAILDWFSDGVDIFGVKRPHKKVQLTVNDNNVGVESLVF